MAGVTVEQLAESVGIPVERLLTELKSAGVALNNAQAVLSETERQTLMSHLKKELPHVSEIVEPKKVTLKRKSVSEIKVTSATGRKTTVSVVSKKRRVYVKKDPLDPEPTVDELSAPVLESPFSPEPTLINPEIPPSAELAEAASAEAAPISSDTPETVAPEATPLDTEARAAKESATPKSAKGKAQIEEDKQRKKGRVQKPAQNEDWRRVVEIIEPETEEPEEAPVASPQAPPVNRPPAGPARKKPKARGRDDRFQRNRPHAEPEPKRHGFEKPQGPLVKEVLLPETITVAELAARMSVKAAEVIKHLFGLGVMATINQPLDQTTAIFVVEAMNHTYKLAKENRLEEAVILNNQEDAQPRAPVITVMGHVDHGKTSLLDYVRRAKVTQSEAGGITQHIGAYHVKTKRGAMTFLDTPGHAAFTAMRARGVNCTDIVVLVIACDDGVKPQTIEAINHAKAAKAPVVVALTKADKGTANLDQIYNDCAQQELIPETWGGDIQFVPVSAKTGEGMDALFDAILLTAELLELKAPAKGPAQGVVLEARLDKGRGPVASLLVRAGCLKPGDILLAGTEYGRLRALINEHGQKLVQAGPSIPLEVLGLSGTPAAGDEFVVVPDERRAREVASQREVKQREMRLSRQQSAKLEGLFDRMQQGDVKTLNIMIKTDVQGSAEALQDALINLSTDDVRVKVISSQVGGITESDINLCMASSALMIGFNVRADATARRLAEQESIDLNYFSVIYDVVDKIRAAMTGLLSPTTQEKILGIALVREVFKSPKLGAIAGCMVTEGLIKRGKPIRVLREHVVIYQGELESLRRFKEDATEVRNGMECGIGVKNYNDVRVGDQIEVYDIVQVAASL